MKLKNYFLINTVLVALLIYFSSISLPPIFTSPEREIEITIKATGNKAINGLGSEVWLYSIKRSGGIEVPWNEVQLDKGWEFRETLAVSYLSQPSIARWKGQISAPLYLYFGTHPYSGEVEISSNDGRVWKEQLYSRVQKKHRKIQIKPSFSLLERAISSLVFSVGISILLLLISRFHHGSETMQRSLYLLGIFSTLLAGAIYAISVSRYFNGLPFNGALQFWNPLRRLSYGDLPGRDFFSFHGIGQAIAFFPLFELLGGDFFASEFLRQFGTYALYIVSGLYFLRSLGLPPLLALALTTASILIEQFFPLAIPKESSLGLRTSLPLLLATISFNLGTRYKNFYYYVFPILGSIAMLWSTEQGPVALVGIALWILIENKDSLLQGILRTTYALSLSIILYLLYISIASKGHPIEILKYSLVDIGGDQRWFFGAPPNPFIARIEDFFTAPVLNSLIYFLISISILILTLIFKRIRNQSGQGLILFVLISNSLASLLMQTGYTSELYNACAERGLYLVACVYIYRLLPNILKSLTVYPAYLIVLVTPIALSQQVSNLNERALSSRSYIYYPKLRSSLGTYYSGLDSAIREIQTHPNTSFHSDYRGFIEELLGSKPITRFDYIIHALGKEKRKEYLNLFKSPPTFIQTLKRSHTQYARWLQQEVWPYYKKILEGYEPFTETASSIIWKIKPSNSQILESNSITIKEDKDTYDIGQIVKEQEIIFNGKMFWEAEIKYNLGKNYLGKGLSRNLIHFEPNPDPYAIPVSIPPYEKTFTFPIIVKNSEFKLHRNTIGLFSSNSDLKIEELKLTPLHYPRISLEAMFELNRNSQ